MAVREHNPSRHAVLGAAASLAVGAVPLPAGGGDAGLLPPDRVRGRNDGRRWGRVLAAYRAAEAELGRYRAYCSGRPHAEQLALEAGYGARSDALYDALRRLLRAPAPDRAAMAAKIRLIVEHEVGTLEGGEACMAALARDSARLLGTIR